MSRFYNNCRINNIGGVKNSVIFYAHKVKNNEISRDDTPKLKNTLKKGLKIAIESKRHEIVDLIVICILKVNFTDLLEDFFPLLFEFDNGIILKKHLNLFKKILKDEKYVNDLITSNNAVECYKVLDKYHNVNITVRNLCHLCDRGYEPLINTIMRDGTINMRYFNIMQTIKNGYEFIINEDLINLLKVREFIVVLGKYINIKCIHPILHYLNDDNLILFIKSIIEEQQINKFIYLKRDFRVKNLLQTIIPLYINHYINNNREDNINMDIIKESLKLDTRIHKYKYRVRVGHIKGYSKLDRLFLKNKLTICRVIKNSPNNKIIISQRDNYIINLK